MSDRIFISYHHNDGDFAENLNTKLRESGFDTWMDEAGLACGDDWRTEIDHAIGEAGALILVMTPDSLASSYVTYEWAFALGAGVDIIPIMLKETDVHPRLEMIQYLDFTNRRARPWDRLIDDLERICARSKCSKKDNTAKGNVTKDNVTNDNVTNDNVAEADSRSIAGSGPESAEAVEVQPCTIKIPENVPQSFKQAVQKLDSTNSKERSEAIDFIGKYNHSATFEVLFSALKHPLVDIRIGAIRWISGFEDPAVVPALKDLIQDRESSVKTEVVLALARIGTPEAVSALVEILNGKDWEAEEPVHDGDRSYTYGRQLTAYFLGEIGDSRAIPGLIEALKDEDMRIREIAAKSLGKVKHTEAVPSLIEALHDAKEEVRLEAAKALGKIKDASAVTGLIETLGDSDQEVRLQAVRSLGEIKDSSSVPGLIGSLNDGYDQIRRYAADALGEIGDAAAVPVLIPLLEDKSSMVRHSSAAALERIGVACTLSSLEELSREESPT